MNLTTVMGIACLDTLASRMRDTTKGIVDGLRLDPWYRNRRATVGDPSGPALGIHLRRRHAASSRYRMYDKARAPYTRSARRRGPRKAKPSYSRPARHPEQVPPWRKAGARLQVTPTTSADRASGRSPQPRRSQDPAGYIMTVFTRKKEPAACLMTMSLLRHQKRLPC